MPCLLSNSCTKIIRKRYVLLKLSLKAGWCTFVETLYSMQMIVYVLASALTVLLVQQKCVRSSSVLATLHNHMLSAIPMQASCSYLIS